MEQERDDQVIYLKDLIFVVLYRWRRVLAAGLALGLVLGAVSAASLWKGRNAQASLAPEALLQEQQEAQDLLDRHMAYRNNSVLLQLDPYCVYSASWELTVDTGYRIQPDQGYQAPDITEPLLNAYGVEISNTVAADMAEALNTEPQYLQEVLQITQNIGTRSLSVKIRCKDAQTAQTLLKLLDDSLTYLQTHATEAVGQHTVKVLGSSVQQVVDLTVTQSLTKAMEQQAALEKSLAEARKAVSAAQTQPEGMSLKKAVILTALGLFGGMFAVACWEWVRHIAGDRIYSRRTFQNKTGLRVLGCTAGTRIRNGIDRWLRKLEGRSADLGHMEIVATHIANRCGQQKLMVVGSAAEESRRLLLEALKKAGVQAVDYGSILDSAQAMKALPDYETVLLAEQCMVSKYTEATKTAEIIADHGKALLGCVLLDS